MKNALTHEKATDLLSQLQARFNRRSRRHTQTDWSSVLARLETKPGKLLSLYEMESTGGEPDVIGQDIDTGEFLFCDCSIQSPAGRRSLCYDREALESRKEAVPKNSVIDLAESMGIELLSESQYRWLQEIDNFDTKTSSWLATPKEVRDLGGAIFGDYRYGRTFVYHNGASSYYAARGFRGLLPV